ncbi:MAG: pyruvate ferredoxin oxidoreductase, partial [Candidatus Lokiarchaeota archaeon]|nr:pyruvate ferredoxin oxidoreductase [Candidatus Lokiarchaeota archaeon]
LSNKILKHKEDIIVVEEKHLEDAEVAIFSYGLVYRAVLETVNTARSEGLKVGSFRPITIWPFPQEQVEELSKKVKTIIVCENNLGQIYPFVKAAANGNAKVIFLPPKILGALYKKEEILNKIKEVI